MISQGFQSLYEVAKLALGDGNGSGSNSGSKLPADAEVYKPKSAEELQQAMYKVFQ